MRWLIPILLALMFLFVVSPKKGGLKVGVPAPEMQADSWLNAPGKIALAQLKDKIVVLEFWATWCPPCQQSIPHFNKLHNRWQGKDVVIIGLTDEPASHVQPFIRKAGIRYIVGTGSFTGLDYGVDSIPHAFVIDGAGQIAWSGFPSAELDQAIEQAHRRLTGS